jgi:predicted RNA-binding Zn-ribbon protein involved in translation (DUF1610 family)
MNDTDIVQEIAERDRDPVTCNTCGDVADGVALIDAIEAGKETTPWICPDCGRVE